MQHKLHLLFRSHLRNTCKISHATSFESKVSNLAQFIVDISSTIGIRIFMLKCSSKVPRFYGIHRSSVATKLLPNIFIFQVSVALQLYIFFSTVSHVSLQYLLLLLLCFSSRFVYAINTLLYVKSQVSELEYIAKQLNQPQFMLSKMLLYKLCSKIWPFLSSFSSKCQL